MAIPGEQRDAVPHGCDPKEEFLGVTISAPLRKRLPWLVLAVAMPMAGAAVALLGVIYQHDNPFEMALYVVAWSAQRTDLHRLADYLGVALG